MSSQVDAGAGDDTDLYLGIYAALSFATIVFVMYSLVVLAWGQLRYAPR
ncbi:MAG: hypothetical protein IH795_03580 [Bacteroidetes bacterium]|nr:hypothetical protein [Bacteroidota bacterium]